MSRSAQATVTISREALVDALRSMTVQDERFDHRQWAEWDAETFEKAAAMIRRGYRGPAASVPIPCIPCHGIGEIKGGTVPGRMRCPSCDGTGSGVVQ